MKIKHYGDITTEEQRKFEVPGFSGYFVSPTGAIMSMWASGGKKCNLKAVKPWRNTYKGKPSGKLRVTLQDNTGKKCNVDFKKIVKLVQEKNSLGKMF